MDVFDDRGAAREILDAIQGLSPAARKTREALFREMRRRLVRRGGPDEHGGFGATLDRIGALPADSDEWMDAILDLRERLAPRPQPHGAARPR